MDNLCKHPLQRTKMVAHDVRKVECSLCHTGDFTEHTIHLLLDHIGLKMRLQWPDQLGTHVLLSRLILRELFDTLLTQCSLLEQEKRGLPKALYRVP